MLPTADLARPNWRAIFIAIVLSGFLMSVLLAPSIRVSTLPLFKLLLPHNATRRVWHLFIVNTSEAVTRTPSTCQIFSDQALLGFEQTWPCSPTVQVPGGNWQKTKKSRITYCKLTVQTFWRCDIKAAEDIPWHRLFTCTLLFLPSRSFVSPSHLPPLFSL